MTIDLGFLQCIKIYKFIIKYFYKSSNIKAFSQKGAINEKNYTATNTKIKELKTNSSLAHFLKIIL